MKTFAVKGHLLFSETMNEIQIYPDHYVVCEDGLVEGIYKELPEKFSQISTTDYGDRLIIPGFTDLHLHAPQYSFRGLGMDFELLDWLNTHTFPEESKYGDLSYADKAYHIFANDLAASATTRACIFSTIHVEATELLMDLLEETGIKAYVGKVNMDRNSPDYLCETNARVSAQDTITWITNTADKYTNIKPILTPRFIPSCTDELMKLLASIQKEMDLPMQSHLSENLGEIAWVKDLCPASTSYGDAYDQVGLFGGDCKTIMAHCVHSDAKEIALMKERGVYVAHCPQSNTNLSSGVAPIRTYLNEGVLTGLGSDIAGGFSLSMFRAISDAIQVSKLRWRLQDDTLAPLTVDEAFYLATKGGGSFFGKVGSFQKGYEFDAVVLDDTNLPHPQELTIKERLERLIYLSDDRNIEDKYVAGVRTLKK